MRDLKDRIERRLGIVFGTFKTPVGRRDDFRFMIRVGHGENREWINFEAAVAGYAIYAGRPSSPQDRTTIRDLSGKTVREIFEKQRGMV